jgi:hypothetical protein
LGQFLKKTRFYLHICKIFSNFAADFEKTTIVNRLIINNHEFNEVFGSYPVAAGRFVLGDLQIRFSGELALGSLDGIGAGRYFYVHLC